MVGLYDRCYLEGQKAIGPGKTLQGGLYERAFRPLDVPFLVTPLTFLM